MIDKIVEILDVCIWVYLVFWIIFFFVKRYLKLKIFDVYVIEKNTIDDVVNFINNLQILSTIVISMIFLFLTK